MSYLIVTDTCCDLPEQMYDELNLSVVRLSVNYREQITTTYTEAWLKDFFDGLRAGEVATTAAVNPTGWETVMEPVLQGGEDVLVLAFSSGLSATYQSAVIAAEELRERYPDRKIHVVDTLCASRGQGLLVYYACQKRDAGFSLEDLTAWCEENKYPLCHWFTVDDLMYLKRGGRVSAATALVGTMLQIKPVLHVDDEGHLVSVAKARGRKGSLDMIVAKVGSDAIEPEKQTMFISHGDCLEDAMYVGNQLKEKYGVPEVKYNYVGPVIGSHTGPGVVAMFYFGKNR